MNLENQATKKPRKRTGLKVFLGLAAITTVLYAGNAFSLRERINGTYQIAKEQVKDTITVDIGERSTNLYNKVIETDNINDYFSELQQMMLAVNESLEPANQYTTIDQMIQQVAPELQERIIETTYNRQSPEFKANFTEQHFDDIPYERQLEIGKDVLKELYEKNKKDVTKNIEDLKENFIELYNRLREKFGGNE